MNLLDYKKIVNRANAAKELCNLIGYDWRNDPLQIDGFKEKYYDEFRRRLMISKEFKSENDVETVSDTVFTEVQWNRYKKIYEFHPTFIRYLASTEAGKIEKLVFEKLPFQSFYISFSGTVMDEPGHEGFVPAIGMFVYVYFSKEEGYDFVNFALSLRGEQESSQPLYCGLKNGVSFTDATDLDKMPKAAYDYITHNGDPEQEAMVRKRQEEQKPFFMIAINACQYLCASNAEIKDVRVPKSDRPFIQNGSKKKAINVQISDVGFRIGQRFEKMYADLEAESRREGKKGIKKRPHVRRAHWHHYWTGKGRTELEVRWLEPVFVMGPEEEIDTVIHKVEGEEVS